MEKPSAQSLNCANCGAPLEVGPTARFATCAHCNTSLEIKRSDSAAWTELIQQVAQETGQIRQELEALRTEQELERLDREWEKEKDSLMVPTEDGRKVAPAGAVIGMVIGAVLLLVMFVIIVSVFSSASRFMASPGPLPSRGFGGGGFSGLLCVIGMIAATAVGFSVVSALGKSQKLDEREAAYRAKRRELLRRLKREE